MIDINNGKNEVTLDFLLFLLYWRYFLCETLLSLTFTHGNAGKKY